MLREYRASSTPYLYTATSLHLQRASSAPYLLEATRLQLASRAAELHTSMLHVCAPVAHCKRFIPPRQHACNRASTTPEPHTSSSPCLQRALELQASTSLRLNRDGRTPCLRVNAPAAHLRRSIPPYLDTSTSECLQRTFQGFDTSCHHAATLTSSIQNSIPLRRFARSAPPELHASRAPRLHVYMGAARLQSSNLHASMLHTFSAQASIPLDVYSSIPPRRYTYVEPPELWRLYFPVATPVARLTL